MSNIAKIMVVVATAFFTLQGCNQGGKVEYRQRPAISSADAKVHETHDATEAGRFDLEFKTESECKKHSGQWDGECFIKCMPPNTFDKATSKCISSNINSNTAHETGRYDVSYKTASTCKANQGTWDAAKSECYLICQPPKTFDKTSQKCNAVGVDPVSDHHGESKDEVHPH